MKKSTMTNRRGQQAPKSSSLKLAKRSLANVKKKNDVVYSEAIQVAFAKVSIAMLIVDRSGHCVEANDWAVKMLGISKMSLVGMPLDQLFPPAQNDNVSFISELVKKGNYSSELTCTRKGKVKISFHVKGEKINKNSYLLTLQDHTGSSTVGSKLWRVDKSTMVLPEFFPLAESGQETDYRSLFQHLPYGICILQNNSIVIANPIFCKMLGYRASDEVVGKQIQGLLEEGSRMFFSVLEQRVFRGETIPSRFETRMLREDGSTIDVETTFALSWYQGAPALNVCINDITDRKELEKRLTDSEGLLRNVIDSMVDALVITDLQGKVLDVNNEFERLTGYSRRDAFRAEIPYPWVPEEDLRSYIGWLEKLREHSVLRDFDITWLRKNGEHIAVSLNTTLLRNSAGDPVLMVNIARDISERHASQRELGRQLQRLQVLYDLTRALTETFDVKEIARITFHQVEKVIPVDAFFINLYDEERNLIREIFNVDIVNGVRSETPADPAPRPLSETMANSKVIYAHKPVLELRDIEPKKPLYLPFGNEERATASLMYVPMFSKDRTIGVLSAQSYQIKAYSEDQLTLLQSIANVTGIAIEKANLYQETISKSLEIEARNKELDDFTYVVSHDLKEPLISVEGYAKIIKHEYSSLLNDAGREYIQSITDSCLHMKRLIDELLQLSRVSKLVEQRSRVDLSKLISDVLEELQFSVREKKAEIHVQENLPKVLGVDTHLRIVFRNLISNALKFSNKPVPQIHIQAQVEHDAVAVSVRDNGIGIDPAYFDKIFMIFQRLHKKEEYEGAGAGLTIVKKIVEANGGRIWVESKLNEGSIFYFTIPRS